LAQTIKTGGRDCPRIVSGTERKQHHVQKSGPSHCCRTAEFHESPLPRVNGDRLVFVSHSRTMKNLKIYDLTDRLAGIANLDPLDPLPHVDFMSVVTGAPCYYRLRWPAGINKVRRHTALDDAREYGTVRDRDSGHEQTRWSV